MEEIWKQIKGYEGLYEISSLAKVKSISRLRTGGNNAIRERIMKPYLSRTGYHKVVLSKNKQDKHISVHRLIALVFVGEPPTDKHEVNHIDGNKLNNSIDNLEWVTRSQNLSHAYKLGLKVGNIGEKNNTTKLSESDVLEIKRLITKGVGVSKIAINYKVTHSTISAIKNKRNWKHLV